MDSSPPSPTIEGRITIESVRHWKLDQVSNWLQENNFREYQRLFTENDITGDVLLEIDHEVLKELKIRSIGDRIRLLVAEQSSPENDRFPIPSLSRSNSNPRLAVKAINAEATKMSLESVKQRCIKVIGEDHQTKTIPIHDVNDAKSILARILQKFNINDEVERYCLFTTLSDTGAARSLTDEELEMICKSADRPEREKLILRKKHQPISREQFKQQLRDKKLTNFFGEKPPSTQIGTVQKLRNFFGQRPPSELISLNLTEYFPGHDSEELKRSARNSIRRASRISAASRVSRKSKAISRSFDDRSNTLTIPNSIFSDDSIIIEEALDDFAAPKWIKGSLIGMGSFGSVYLGLNAVTGELMAVKQVELPTGQSANEERKQAMLDALQREIALLKDLHHENIVQYLGSQHDKMTLNIFLEYVPGGSVTTMINNYGPLKEKLIKSFVKQILQGLNYLHEKDIIHRDIKGANVLVDSRGKIKISDFGISKKVEDQFMEATSAHRPSLQGSVFWMAPEVVKQTAYTSKVDIWSLGCLIVEMFTGDHPFPEFNQMQAMFKIGSESCAPEIPPDLSNDAVDFLKKTFELAREVKEEKLEKSPDGKVKNKHRAR
ncbi:6504_t:CDS:10 [Entrophospora sp. SA101]|nr:7221_t:CDS:10 [Entrophospora sp. SA101]CAJ0877187.1 6504_t:CDS:10 [Entrophospora sp. SA101]